MKIRAHVLIAGKVQGVFFRSETLRRARKHHLTGWIRNMADERVEAVFEGEEDDVKKLLKYCRQGPPSANVKAMKVKLEPFSGKFSDFETIY